MPSFNKVILLGNITRDPEMRTTGSGKSVCDIGLAINEKRGGEEYTSFFDVTAWNKTAEIVAEYCRKGSPVLVEGRLVQDRWEQDGNKRSKVKVVAERVRFLGRQSATSDEVQDPRQGDESPQEPTSTPEQGEKENAPF